jgi:ABC-type bacteriocin/lantibiotic exporter with double-glycine peptidase domain
MQRSVLLITALMIGLCGAAYAADANVWVDVPFVMQQKDGCGAASMAMVMQYWERHEGWPASANAESAHILRALYSDAAHGIYASSMERYMRLNGYRTFAFAGQWADLERNLEMGRPLIVALKPDASRSLHYVVVAGVDDSQQIVLLNDPAQRKLLKVERSRFEREWHATEHWTLLAVPRTSTR